MCSTVRELMSKAMATSATFQESSWSPASHRSKGAGVKELGRRGFPQRVSSVSWVRSDGMRVTLYRLAITEKNPAKPQ